jgi:hypothetical protein
MLLNMRPSVLNVSAPLTTLMVVISTLNSYPWTYLPMFQLAPYGLAIVFSFLLSLALGLLLSHYYLVPIVPLSSYCF